MLLKIISLLFFLSLSSVAAYSAVFNISSGDVTGLIDAINTANSNGEADTINLEPGTYILTPPGLPSITSEIIINGADPEITIIERSSFDVAGSAKLTINRLTKRGGGAFQGGGIFNQGMMTIMNSTVANNFAGRFAIGGGISNNGVLKIISSTISGNTAGFFGSGSGGGIANGAAGVGQPGTVELQNSILALNEAERSARDCSGPITSLGNNII